MIQTSASTAERPVRRITSMVGIATLVFAAVAATIGLCVAWFSRGILDGESSSVLSVGVAFSETGELTYTLYEYIHRLFGFTQSMVHPPLHYALTGGVIALFGHGPLQYVGGSVAVAAAGLMVVAIACGRLYGFAAAGLGLILILALRIFYDPATGGRSDVMLGFCYLITVLACVVALFNERAAVRRVAGVLAGFFAVAGVAAHYYGVMALGLAPVVAAGLIVRHRMRAASDIAVSILGACAASLTWYVVYGDDLWRIAPTMSVISEVIGERISTPFSAFLAGVTEHSGGRALVVGWCLMAVYLAARLFHAARAGSWRPFDRRVQLEAFLLYASCWPVVFLFLFTGNHNYRYWIDFLFVVAIVSAGGYWHTFNWLAGRLRAPAQMVVTAGLAITALVTATLSPAIMAYATVNPASLQNPNRLHREVRTALLSLMPGNGSVLMGSPAFQFLADRPVVSSMDLVLQELFEIDAGTVGFEEASERYREKMRTYPRNLPDAQRLKAAAVARAEYIVVGEDCHFWSCLFFDPVVWQPEYRRVGSVVTFRTNLTGMPNPTLRSIPRLFTVFLRKDEAAGLATVLPMKGALHTGVNTGTIIYPPVMPDVIDGDLWKQASGAERRGHIASFLASVEWFGIVPPERQREVVQQLLGPIEAAFIHRSVRDLAAAFELAMTDAGLWRLFVARPRS